MDFYLHQQYVLEALECETEKYLALPQFLRCSTDTLVKVLKQDAMSVPELEVWRATLRWAKNKAKSEDPKSLRKQLEEPLKHLRVCLIPYEDFCKEVAPSGILTNDEIAAICIAHGTKQPPALPTVCTSMEFRKGSTPREKLHSLFIMYGRYGKCSKEFSFILETHDIGVEITGLHVNIDTKYDFTCTVKFEPVDSLESAITVTKSGSHSCVAWSYLPISDTTYRDRDEILLSSRKEYKITLSCEHGFHVVRVQEGAFIKNEHFTLKFLPYEEGYGSPVFEIFYKMLIPQ